LRRKTLRSGYEEDKNSSRSNDDYWHGTIYQLNKEGTMFEIQEVLENDFDATYPLLLTFNNQDISRDRWRRLFTRNWEKHDKPLGYKLVAGSSVVGFVSLIFSERNIRNNRELFCNISSYIVDPDYRKYSIELLYPLLELKKCTCTSFTPSPTAYEILVNLFSFTVLEEEEIVLPITPSHSVRNSSSRIIEYHQDLQGMFIKNLLDSEKTIFSDHLRFDCRHLLIETKDNLIYAIFKLVKYKRIPLAKLYYLSNQKLFMTVVKSIRYRLCRVLGVLGIIIDSRFYSNTDMMLSKKYRLKTPMLCKTENLEPGDIDYLYSEYFLLGA
jgi:hypothetical protein